VSGVREEVYGQKEHDFVPVEELLGANRENLVTAGVRSGRCGSEANDALEEVLGVLVITIRAWLCRRGWQGKKLKALFSGVGTDSREVRTVVGER
jgi:hypothetical protein